MATIEDLKVWIENDLTYRSPASKKIHDITKESLTKHPQNHPYYRIEIFTFTNRYTIYAVERPDGGYLGCGATSRKSRTGEDWLRGNDLPDGKLTKDTWNKILHGIICYELEDISNTGARLILI